MFFCAIRGEARAIGGSAGRIAQTAAGDDGATGWNEQVGKVALVHEKLPAMALGNDDRIAGRDEDERNALGNQEVGDGEAGFSPEEDVQANDIDRLSTQDLECRRYRPCLGDDGGPGIAKHVMDQFADELGILDQQDPKTIHLHGGYSMCPATYRV